MKSLPITIHEIHELRNEYSMKLKEYNEKKRNYEKEYSEILANFDKSKNEVTDNSTNLTIRELRESVNMLNVSFSELWDMVDELDELRNKIEIITSELNN